MFNRYCKNENEWLADIRLKPANHAFHKSAFFHVQCSGSNAIVFESLRHYTSSAEHSAEGPAFHGFYDEVALGSKRLVLICGAGLTSTLKQEGMNAYIQCFGSGSFIIWPGPDPDLELDPDPDPLSRIRIRIKTKQCLYKTRGTPYNINFMNSFILSMFNNYTYMYYLVEITIDKYTKMPFSRPNNQTLSCPLKSR